MQDCIFCSIVAHAAPAAIIYEDEASLAFLDIHPLTRGHTLVIPRQHWENIFELDREVGAAVMRATIKVAQVLRAELEPDGLNLLQSSGRAAGQTIFHFHFHLVPRWTKDKLFLPHRPLAQAEPRELEELAALLRRQMEQA